MNGEAKNKKKEGERDSVEFNGERCGCNIAYNSLTDQLFPLYYVRACVFVRTYIYEFIHLGVSLNL